MPLALMAVFMAPLLMAPLWTAALWRTAIAHERDQIAYDNAAIVWGQRLRLALRGLSAAEDLLAASELAHHPLHACAKLKPPCVALDTAAEQGIRIAHAAAERAFRALEAAAWGAARAELGARVSARLERPTVQLRTVRCALCRLPVRWRVRVGDGAVVETAAPGRRRVIRWSGAGARWDYRVAWRETMAASSSK